MAFESRETPWMRSRGEETSEEAQDFFKQRLEARSAPWLHENGGRGIDIASLDGTQNLGHRYS